jgi:radical SAM superfamily enzyme YgiQ (UPF0313 family)
MVRNLKTGNVLLINVGFQHTPQQVLDAPLGLSYIGAYLRQHGHNVEAIDLSVEQRSLKEVLDESCGDYDLVGISFTTCTYNSLHSICKLVKTANPNCWVILGGPHATFCAEEILLQIPQVDIIVLGEGEESLLEILIAKLDNHSISPIKGIAYRKGGKILFTPKRPLVHNIDKIPKPSRELFMYSTYIQRHIITSRGCPFNCIFCVSPSMFGREIRFRSIHSVFDELKEQLSVGYTKIFIADDIFTINSERVITFCDLIQKHALHFSWGCLSRVDTLTKDIVSAMAKAGCVEISLGCESGSSDILKKINKKIEPYQILEAVSLLRSFNIKSRTSWIIGLPGEDPTTIDETIAIMTKALPDTITIYSPIPYPGTPLATNAAKFGMKVLIKDYDYYWSGTPKPVMLPKNLQVNEYFGLLRKVISKLESVGYIHLRLDVDDIKHISGKKVVVTEFFPSIALHGKKL